MSVIRASLTASVARRVDVARRVLPLIVLLATGLPIAAQTSEKEGGKQLKSALKLASKEIGAALKVATKELDVKLKAASAKAKSGDAVIADAVALFGDLDDFQKAVADAVRVAESVYDGPVADILDDIEGDFGGVHPQDFNYGDGGQLDAFREEITKLTAKPYSKLRKQLRAYTRSAEQDSGLFVSIRIEPVQLVQEPAINAGDSPQAFTASPLSLDILMGISLGASGSPASNRILVAGSANSTVTVRILGPAQQSGPASALGFRYSTSVGSGKDTIARGNYSIGVGLDGDSATIMSAISIR
jgi:hypothetical protein